MKKKKRTPERMAKTLAYVKAKAAKINEQSATNSQTIKSKHNA